ncbi:hypothetical protein C7S20_09915 [Christiangramia fulva]|uniref:Murein L,D-transpeptidase catalytic domain family protein n=1 Tax=Christiangramia fulva TaxID=2126553 RepID=A0A2R3ZAZ1_9FLAO|nr:murein L,D-transpeptidase catalytic domain family protein [Christiangramia fulva]AVR47410.1 hypothetical protein C7S20_09915 [Christiangramia fulva]
MKYRILTVIGVLIFSFAFSSTDAIIRENKSTKTPELNLPSELNKTFEEKTADLYKKFSLKNSNLPALPTFERAFKGYTKLQKSGKVSNHLLTIIDFDLSSTKKRMWILDMDTEEVLFNTYVAHGQKTGVEFAKSFSNKVNSHKSSLGFYVTGKTYYGKNGLSLFMDGMEKNFNSNARKRYVVIHGADYAEPSFIKSHGRLGRSYGCPAVPKAIAENLINSIKGKSVVYINKSDQDYLSKSQFLNFQSV